MNRKIVPSISCSLTNYRWIAFVLMIASVTFLTSSFCVVIWNKPSFRPLSTVHGSRPKARFSRGKFVRVSNKFSSENAFCNDFFCRPMPKPDFDFRVAGTFEQWKMSSHSRLMPSGRNVEKFLITLDSRQDNFIKCILLLLLTFFSFCPPLLMMLTMNYLWIERKNSINLFFKFYLFSIVLRVCLKLGSPCKFGDHKIARINCAHYEKIQPTEKI